MRFLPHELYQVPLSFEELKLLIETSFELKKTILQIITDANSGHPGGSLSSIDIINCLYGKIMNINPNNPDDPNRDRFILSKGHAAPALYATLVHYGFFQSEQLKTFRQFKSILQGHPKRNIKLGIEVSTGSLGMGASMATGIALAGKLRYKISRKANQGNQQNKQQGNQQNKQLSNQQNKQQSYFKNDRLNRNLPNKPYHVYCLLGDGECDEGIVWESAMFASHNHLDNLTFIVDRNSIQLDGSTESILSIEPFSKKWEAFGWNVIEIDGTSIQEIINALKTATQLKGRPTVIIAYLIKGQGVDFMEHIHKFHGTPPTKEQFEQALIHLENYKSKMLETIKRE